jgi:hypothetical protein
MLHIDERSSPTEQGIFVFTAVPPGPFQLTVTGEGFATQQVPGVLHPGEALEVPLISLPADTGKAPTGMRSATARLMAMRCSAP